MVPNRMVRVGGVKCSHHNGAREDRSGLPRGYARLKSAEPRGTRPPVDLRKRKYGAGGPVWVPYKPQNRAWGHPRGNVDRVGGCFVRVSRARVPGADVTRVFFGSRIFELSLFLEIEYSNCLAHERLSA